MSSEHTPGIRLAGRISRHATVYAAAASMNLAAGVLGVVVYTRYVDPSEFGRLAVLSTIASMLMVLLNMGTLQGTMRRVYGSSGDEEVGEDEDDDTPPSGDPKLSLATGIVLTAAAGLACLFLAWPARSWLAGIAVGDSEDGTLVILTVATGAAGALMRLTRNIVRLQRKPISYLVITTVSAMGGIAAAIPLLEQGYGIEGILLGYLIGNLAAVVINLAVLREDIRFAFSLSESAEIARSGVYYLPLVLSFQVIQLADTLLVARFGSFEQTGIYRVAQKTATPVSFSTSVFIQSWGPMRRDLVNVAARQDQSDQALSARVVTHFSVFVSAIVLLVGMFADLLVHIASDEYLSAAEIVPLMALSVAGHGWFVMSYRVSTVPRKRVWFLTLSMLAAVIFVAAAALLIPALGAVGAPLAGILAWGVATIAMIVLAQVSGPSIPFEYGKLGALALLTFGTWALGFWVVPDNGVGNVLRAALFLAWAGSLIACRIVPRDEVSRFARFLRDAAGSESGRAVRAAVDRLDPRSRELVDGLVRQRESVADVAARAGLSEDEALATAVQSLRAASGGGAPTQFDVAIGRLLFTSKASAERDFDLGAMVREGLDPLDADQLMRATTAVRRRAF
jgi:O-antigen/teichoic acid export membrane protein